MTMKVKFELFGHTPLLVHADDIEQADLLGEWRDDPANKNLKTNGDDRTPPWTWQSYLYYDDTHLRWPSQNLMVALRTAGAQLKMRGRTTFKQITQSGMCIPQELLQFTTGGNPVPIAPILAMRDEPYKVQADRVKELGFKLFAKRAAIGKAKHIRVRARFEAWEIAGEIEVTAKEITYDVLTQLFDLACHQGQGDWRPGCKTPGPFGTFKVKLKKLAG